MEMGGDKPNRARNKIRNAETTLTILKGGPTFYNMNGTRDGIDALSAESIPNAKQGFFAGLAMQDITIGKIRECQTSGVCEYGRVVLTSRAATTDVWASYAAGVVGDVLSVHSGAGVQALSRTGAASAGILPVWALGSAYASATTQASSVSSGVFGASLFLVINTKVFIRSL